MAGVENPILSNYHLQKDMYEPIVIGKCNYKPCREEIYEKNGYMFNDNLYCSTGCVAEQLLKDEEIVDLSI